MSRKNRKTKTKKSKQNSIKKPENGFKIKRRNLIQLFGVAALSVPAYMAISAYVEKQNVRYDLSAIGQGKPVLVQVHDPNCPKCRKLLSSVESVIDEFPELEFRIASIKSNKGGMFAFNHSVSHVSLVLLNGEGNEVKKVTGLQTEQQVRLFLKQAVKSI